MRFERKRLERLFAGRGFLGPDWEDLRALHSIVDNCGCRRILEYGSGCSTAVMGSATQGMVVSLEGDVEWWQTTSQMLAEGKLWDRVCLVACSYAANAGVKNFLAIGGRWDLVYVDGPPVDEGEVNAIMSDSDIIVVDGREDTQAMLERELSGEYDYVRNRDQGIFVRKGKGEYRRAHRLFA